MPELKPEEIAAFEKATECQALFTSFTMSNQCVRHFQCGAQSQNGMTARKIDRDLGIAADQQRVGRYDDLRGKSFPNNSI
jgi:hypothetical protein